MTITNIVTSGTNPELPKAPEGAFFIDQIEADAVTVAEEAQFALADYITTRFTGDAVSRQIAATILAHAEPSELPGEVQSNWQSNKVEDAEHAWVEQWMKPLLQWQLAALGQRAVKLFDSIADIRKDPQSALLVSAFPAENMPEVETANESMNSNHHLTVRSLLDTPETVSAHLISLVVAPPLSSIQPSGAARTEHAMIHSPNATYYGRAYYRRTGAEASHHITPLVDSQVTVSELVQVAEFADSLELSLSLAESQDNRAYFQKIRRFPQLQIEALMAKLDTGETDSVRYDDSEYPAQPIVRIETKRSLQPSEIQAIKEQIQAGPVVNEKTPRIKSASPKSALADELTARYTQPSLFD